MNKSAENTSCDCDGCRTGGLPANPFLAPRVVHGMLLGEDDFATMTGYPRGKHMLHQAWCHGAGVVWGYRVHAPGTYDVCVGPGLALDAHGREVLLETTKKLDLRDLRDIAVHDGRLVAPADGCGTTCLRGWVVAEFTGCQTAPVPTLADPCDVTRSHDDCSRVAERARVHLTLDRPPEPPARYRRVRMLLGLDDAGDPDDPVVEAALKARAAVLGAADRTHALEHELHRMACLDAMDLAPALVDEHVRGWLPVLEEDTAVLLARVEVELDYVDGCWEFVLEPCVSPCVRSTLLPTDVITALTAGRAPALLGSGPATSVEGPRVDAAHFSLEDDDRRLVLPVDAELVPGTVAGAVLVTILDPKGSDRWVENVYEVEYDETRTAIVVRLEYSLAGLPDSALVRVRVRGTGAKPVMGRDPLLPLAGLVDGPPGNPEEGHDAVFSFTHAAADEAADATADETAREDAS